MQIADPTILVTGASRPAAAHAAEWLSLAAAPALAVMAVFTAILGSGAHPMVCSATSPVSALGGMVSMYAAMSVFHIAPWLKLMSQRQSGAGSAGSS